MSGYSAGMAMICSKFSRASQLFFSRASYRLTALQFRVGDHIQVARRLAGVAPSTGLLGAAADDRTCPHPHPSITHQARSWELRPW